MAPVVALCVGLFGFAFTYFASTDVTGRGATVPLLLVSVGWIVLVGVVVVACDSPEWWRALVFLASFAACAAAWAFVPLLVTRARFAGSTDSVTAAATSVLASTPDGCAGPNSDLRAVTGLIHVDEVCVDHQIAGGRVLFRDGAGGGLAYTVVPAVDGIAGTCETRLSSRWLAISDPQSGGCPLGSTRIQHSF